MPREPTEPPDEGPEERPIERADERPIERPVPDHDDGGYDRLAPAERQALFARAREARAETERLHALDHDELLRAAAAENIDLPPAPTRPQLLFLLQCARATRTGIGYGGGVLEVLPEGFGFLRSAALDFAGGDDDVYISPAQIHRLGLRPGHEVHGPLRPPRRGESYLALLRVDTVGGQPVDQTRGRIPFDERLPVLPTRRLRLDHPGAADIARAIDLLLPWGRGQRVLLRAARADARRDLAVAIAAAASAAADDLVVHLCLLDAAPEDATAARAAADRLGVVATTFDQPGSRQLLVADLTLQRCQRLAEAGRDVLLVFDSLTALARHSQLELPAGSRVLVPGIEPLALLRAKRLFAAARNLEGGGSLTVVATAAAGTGDVIDEAIAAEFAGRGNSDLVLAPAADVATTSSPTLELDIARSRTRREDLLLPPPLLPALAALRQQLAATPAAARAAALAALLQQHADNDALLHSLRP